MAHQYIFNDMNSIARLILILYCGSLFGQIQDNIPYIINTENLDYYLKSVPYTYKLCCNNGKTELIKRTDSSVVFKIDRYLNYAGICASEDYRTILYIEDECKRDFASLDKEEVIIRIFIDGKEQIILTRMNLFQNLKDSSFLTDYFLFKKHEVSLDFDELGTGENKKIYRTNTYVVKDTAFIEYINGKYLKLNLSNGVIIGLSERISKVTIPKFRVLNKLPSSNKLPNLSNGQKFESAMESFLNLKYECSVLNDDYEYYYLDVECFVGNDGGCVIISLEYTDTSRISELKAFLNEIKFKQDYVDADLSTWTFSQTFAFRCKDDIQAKFKKDEDRKKDETNRKMLISKDSINGYYIPINIEDCFTVLDHMLSHSEQVLLIDENSNYDHDLKVSLISRWNLDDASRLREFFFNKAIIHPYNMSHIIVETYKRKLLKRPLKLEEYIEQYSYPFSPEYIQWSLSKDNWIEK